MRIKFTFDKATRDAIQRSLERQQQREQQWRDERERRKQIDWEELFSEGVKTDRSHTPSFPIEQIYPEMAGMNPEQRLDFLRQKDK